MSLIQNAAVRAARSFAGGCVGGSIVLAAAGACWLSPGAAFGETRTVTLGPEYEASGLWKLWFGSGYRDLWITPVELEVLDLEEEAGGLSVVRSVGGRQTLGLALRGADGRAYTFRIANKDPSRMLPEDWQESLPARVFKDQAAASHPGSAQVVVPLRAAVGGILQTPPWRLVVMPDSEALGEHRATFGGVPGTFSEYPMGGTDGHPGFHGASEVLSTLELWKVWHEGPQHAVDVRAFLKARLMNLFVGDWDRHYEQWRWALLPDENGYQPIPEDPDQAFSDYGGEMLRLARWQTPRLLTFEDEIAGMVGATFNGRDVDQWLLAELERRDFVEMAVDLRDKLTDSVIEDAVKSLLPEWYAVGGDWLSARLKRRRDSLVDAAERCYLHLARNVNVRGTDLDELARIRRFEDGSLEITVAVAADGNAAAEPYFRRRFDPNETREVRLYLAAGNDRIESEGPAKDAIKVRVLGGKGNDVLDDSRSGRTRFIDYEGSNEVIAGEGTQFDERPWSHPAPIPGAAPWLEPVDSGARTIPELMAWWEPDLELFVGAGLSRTAWGFRKYPNHNFNRVFAGYSTGRRSGLFEYEGVFRRMNSSLYFTASARASGIDSLNFYGFGNETPGAADRDFFQVEEKLVSFFPTVSLATNDEYQIYFGPFVQFTDEQSKQTLISALQPYGSGEFGEIGVALGFSWDSRGPVAPVLGLTAAVASDARPRRPRTSGVKLVLEGEVFPEAWDVEEIFGAVEGALSGYVGLGTERVVLAARVGGRRVWGESPWHEAAFVGGPDTNRGLREQRFAGEGALFGNLELRVQLFNGKFLLPGRYWVFGLADVGRVWVDGEDSKEWHPSFGGGLAVDVMGTGLSFWIGAANSRDQGTRVYVRSGVTF